jgi:hypothetical protein
MAPRTSTTRPQLDPIEAAPKQQGEAMAVRVASKMQDELLRLLPWLTHAFGISQRMTGQRDGGAAFRYPAAYIGAGEYTNTLPTDALGNYSFIVIDDPQKVAFQRFRNATIRCTFSLVVWYDLRRIFHSTEQRNTEEVKRQLLHALSVMELPEATRLGVASVYEQAENVWRGYTLSEQEAQYMTHPYGALRLEGELTYVEGCAS